MPVFCTTNSMIEYYPIVAETPQELDKQLSLNNRNGYSADTKWTINTRYRFKNTNFSCLLDDFKVELEIIHTMPEWINKSNASIELQTLWDAWYSNLLKHEENHGFHGQQAYNDIKQSLYVSHRANNCAQLTTNLKVLVDRILFKYTQEDKYYDQRTNHGESEGASINFSTSLISE